MADSTCNAVVFKEMEERLAARFDARLVGLTGLFNASWLIHWKKLSKNLLHNLLSMTATFLMTELFPKRHPMLLQHDVHALWQWFSIDKHCDDVFSVDNRMIRRYNRRTCDPMADRYGQIRQLFFAFLEGL